MKRKMNRKIAVIVITVLVLSLALGAAVFADDGSQMLKAWFKNISIYRNNQQIQLGGDNEPFIVEDTTYVPLRTMANLFNKEVGWDGEKYRIDLNDRPDENLISMTHQLYEAQVKVLGLEAKVKQLEEELADNKAGKKGSLGDMESYLNKQYGTYKKIEFDINLYENKKNIEVDIYVDLDYDYREWDNLSTSNKKSYLQNIVDDILDDYKNVDIEGSIMDSSTSRKSTLVSFYTKSNGTVVIDTDSWYDDLDDLEDYLNDNYYRYYGGYYDVYVYFDIRLFGDEDDIEVNIISRYDDDLDYLREYEIKEYLEEIYYEIAREFPRAYVDGYIEDDYIYYEFDFDSRGYARLY